jgi:hypothetical protein
MDRRIAGVTENRSRWISGMITWICIYCRHDREREILPNLWVADAREVHPKGYPCDQ